MVHVIIDTTVLRQDPHRKKGPLRAIYRLSASNLLRLYVPEVVKREFIAQEQALQAEAFRNFKQEAQALLRRPLPPAWRSVVEAAIVGITASSQVLEDAFMESEFDNWLKSCSGRLLQTQSHHAREVLDAYFVGSPPFRKVRRREDFPDAFIWQSVLDLAMELGHSVYFVSDDQGFEAAAAQRGEQIRLFRSVRDLIADPALQELLAEATSSLLVELSIPFVEKQNEIIRSELEGMLHGFGDATIVEISELTALSAGAGEYLGEGQVMVAFSATVECRATESMTWEKLHGLRPPDRAAYDVLAEDETYVVCQAILKLAVAGQVVVEVDPSSMEEYGLDDQLSNAKIWLESIDEESSVR